MKNKFLKITFVLAICMCFIFGKDMYASSMTLSGSTSGSPNSTVNVKVGGDFIGRVNVTVSNGTGSTSVWIENSTSTIAVSLGSSGTTTVSASTAAGTSDANGNVINTISKSLPISIVQPVVNPTPNNNNTNNNTSTNNNSSNNTATTTNKTTVNTATTQKSSNAYLKTLQVNQEGLTPNFNKSKTSYSITVGENVDSLKVTATPEDSTAKVAVSGNTGLKSGDNKVYVTVTAQDGTKKVYTITVTKTADQLKSNSYLQSLIVENATLSPEFSKENLEYSCGTVGASVENLKILAFGENENVKVDVIGNDNLVEGENTITVRVTSEDGITTKDYIIKVIKDSSIVEEENFEEINPLQNTNNDNKIVAFFKDVWNRIKANWLVVLMYVVILVEFVQILYLYKRRNIKSNKVKNKEKVKDVNLNVKREPMEKVEVSKSKNISLDKEYKLNKKRHKKLDVSEEKALNDGVANKKRLGAKRFDSNDKI